jgi:hypothetical protein
MAHRALPGVFGLLAVVGFSLTVAAAPGGEPGAEIQVNTGELYAYTDGKGHYVAVKLQSGATFASEFEPGGLYYSPDGKTFWQQQTGHQAGDPRSKDLRGISFWEPRADSIRNEGAEFRFGPGLGRINCSEKRTVDVTEVRGEDKAKLFAGAVFRAPRWAYAAYALARDDAGNYVYVDHEVNRPRAFRLWRGPRGNMKPLAMTNVVSDSRGDIFTTKDGQLRLVVGKQDRKVDKDEQPDPQPLWIKGKARTPLTWVPVRDNPTLIYQELGVYQGQLLGTPCDDF